MSRSASRDRHRDRTDPARHGVGGRRPRRRGSTPAIPIPSSPSCGPRRRWRGTRSTASGPSPRHADVSAIGFDHQTFCAGRGSWWRRSVSPTRRRPTMMHTDPPHTRYRRLVQPGFKPSVVRALETGRPGPGQGPRRRHRRRRADRRRGRPCRCRCPCRSSARSSGLPVEDWRALLRVVRGRHPRRHRLARGAPQRADGRDGRPTSSSSPGAPGRAERRRPHGTGEGLHRRRPIVRRRARHVPRPVARRRQRDHPQHDLGRPVAFADHPGQWERLARRPRPRGRRQSRRCFATPPPSSPSCAPPPATTELAGRGHRRRRARAHALRLGQPRRGGLRPDRRPLRRRPLTRTPTWPSDSATTSASARRWPGSRAGSCSRSSSTASARSPSVGDVERSGSSVIAGVRRAELSFEPA